MTVASFVKIAHQTSGGPTLSDDDLFNGSVKVTTRIASGVNGGPTLGFLDRFGFALTSIGDLDGDGVTDLAVGATFDSTGGTGRGAVHILSLNADGTVKNSTKIADSTNGGPVLVNFGLFGSSVASPGDLDGDGVVDLAVGALDNVGGTATGSVYVLLMNSDGTVKSNTKIDSSTSGGPTIAAADLFGWSVAAVGDLDGDEVADLAVGAIADDTGGPERGAVHVLLLNPGGTVKSSVKIASGTSGGLTLANDDAFGDAISSLGDLNGDGVIDLAVAAADDDTGGTDRGAVYVLPLGPVPPDLTAPTLTSIARRTHGQRP